MFYKLMCQRSYQRYKKSYINILLVFILSLSMLSFVNIFCDSLYNYTEEVSVPFLMTDHTCDIRVKNIKESEVGLFYGVPNVEMEYRDGNLDFFLIDTEKFEETLRYIQIVFNGHKRFAEYIETHDHLDWDETPWISVYYGVDVHENIETTNTARITTYVLQLLMLPLAVTAMIMIYNNYIKQRAEDIRTLVGIGISEQQLKKLFFIECNILYLISAVIGAVMGGLLVWLNCLVCEFTDMSQTNAVYPIFHVDFLSLLVILLLGYAAVNITFLVGLKRILKMDASYTCADTVVEFKPDKSRFLYYRSKRSFRRFFLPILRKRSTNTYGVLGVLVAVILMLSVFLLNGTSYAVTMYDISASAELAAFISNFSLFIVLILYAIVFSWIIIYVFTKRQMESCAETVKTLYILGADEKTIYSCFRRLMIRRVIVTELFGIIIGFAASSKIFEKFGYPITVNAWLTVGTPVLIIAYWIVYLFSLKKNFMKNCRNFASDETGG